MLRDNLPWHTMGSEIRASKVRFQCTCLATNKMCRYKLLFGKHTRSRNELVTELLSGGVHNTEKLLSRQKRSTTIKRYSIKTQYRLTLTHSLPAAFAAYAVHSDAAGRK